MVCSNCDHLKLYIGEQLLAELDPGEIIGENPFALVAGVGAVWVKTREVAGTIRVTARHPVLGTKTVQIQVTPAEPVSI